MGRSCGYKKELGVREGVTERERGRETERERTWVRENES